MKLALNNLPVFLFPHSYIGEKAAEIVQIHFRSLNVCVPWFLKFPGGLPESGSESFIKVLNPPVDLKPKEGFMSLLSEYRQWIKNDYDKGYSAFFSIALEPESTEGSPWKIRQMMNQRFKDQSSETPEANALKWHLILHLAREFEDDLTQAEEMLKKVKLDQPPLKNALGDDIPLKGLSDDLPTDKIALGNKSQTRQVMEAWFGLFGGYLPDNGVLLTLDGGVMDYIMDMFDNEIYGVPRLPDEVPLPDFSSIQQDFIVKHIPRISGEVNSDVKPMRGRISGKTIIMPK